MGPIFASATLYCTDSILFEIDTLDLGCTLHHHSQDEVLYMRSKRFVHG